MNRIFYILSILLLSSLNLTAQKLFTKMLAEKSSKGAEVIVHHSAYIDSLVNGLKTFSDVLYTIDNVNTKKQENNISFPEIEEDTVSQLEVKYYKKADGFRVQIYTGANSRKDKETALAMKEKCADLLPGYNAYVSFESPRWVVRVGDFLKREDAVAFVSTIRAISFTHEARVVKCTIQVPVN